MSNPQQPTRKQMILQQLMLMAVVFLGFQMFCNPQRNQQVDTRAALTILGDVKNPASGEPPVPDAGQVRDPKKGTLAWANSTLRAFTAAELNAQYQRKLDEAVKKELEKTKDQAQQKALEDEVLAKKAYGDLLQADTQYKRALIKNDTNAMRMVHQTLQVWENRLKGKPLWEQKFDLPEPELAPLRFPWSTTRSVPQGGKLIPASEVTPEGLAAANWVADTPGQYRFYEGEAVPGSGGNTPAQTSLKDLNERVVANITARSESDLVYGIFPGYKIIDFLVNLTGAVPGFSYAFAAFLLALIVRAIIFPVAQKQLLWGRKMQQLAPLVKEIREQYTDKKTKQVTNQVELQQKTMALYQEYGINPLAGCLPALIQFPLFITVYQFMLNYQFAFTRGTFLWVAPGPSAASNGFFAANLGQRDYVLIILYGITMVISTLLMPASDPAQAKQQKLIGVAMGLVFTVLMFTGMFPTPAAFVLYWVFTNLLATAQSVWVYRMPMPPLEKVNTKAGGVFPMPPFSNGTGNGKTNGAIPTKTSTGTPAKHKPKKRK